MGFHRCLLFTRAPKVVEERSERLALPAQKAEKIIIFLPVMT